ncbi:MAG: hypothetical protein ACK40M_07255 [Flavobacteriales bacterium]
MNYLDLFKGLQDKNVRYLICGGLAMNLYGVPRMTADIDLLLDLNQSNTDNFSSVLKEMGYQPVLPMELSSLLEESKRVQLKNEKNLIAFSYYNSISNQMNIDVLLFSPLLFDDMYEKKVIRHHNDLELYLVCPDDLITLKSHANRVQDNQDIQYLKKISGL